jgi:hypothetical protein
LLYTNVSPGDNTDAAATPLPTQKAGRVGQ